MKKRSQDMLHGPLLHNIIIYTIPIILTSLLQLLFNAADLVVVGRFCGSASVAAVGATGSVTNLIVSLFIGLSVGAGVSVAHAVGSGDKQMLHRVVHTAVPVALVSGAVLTVVGVLLARMVLTWMGTPEEVLPLSTVYMQIYFGGILFTMVYNFGAAILRAVGETQKPLIFLSIAGVLNVVLNVIFVTIFHMNVAGVALATVISQGVSMALVLGALVRRTDDCKLELKKMRFYAAPLRKIVALGLPAGIQGSLFGISNVMIQSSINSFGDVFLSGSAAAGNLESFIVVILNAFHQTALNFTGQNAGAGQYRRVSRVLWLCIGCVTVLGIIAGGLMYLFAGQLLPIYITDSQEAIGYGMLRMRYVCLFYFALGLMDVTTGVLRGLGSSLVPMLISIMGVCVLRIGWIATIFQVPQYHTPECLFLSYPVSWTVTFICQIIACMVVYRNRQRRFRL